MVTVLQVLGVIGALYVLVVAGLMTYGAFAGQRNRKRRRGIAPAMSTERLPLEASTNLEQAPVAQP